MNEYSFDIHIRRTKTGTIYATVEEGDISMFISADTEGALLEALPVALVDAFEAAGIPVTINAQAPA